MLRCTEIVVTLRPATDREGVLARLERGAEFVLDSAWPEGSGNALGVSVETVEHMAEVIVGAETHRVSLSCRPRRIPQGNYPAGDAWIALAAMTIASHCRDIRAIICQTETGNSAQLMSRVRSGIPIFAFCRHAASCSRAALYRGVYPVQMDVEGLDGVPREWQAAAHLKKSGLLKPGDFVPVSRGYHQGIGGSTHTPRVLRVE